MPTILSDASLKASFRNSFTLLFIFSLLFSNSLSSQNMGNTFRMPAEFEPHQAVWLSWDDEDTEIQETVVNIIKGLIERVPIKIATPTAQLQNSAKKALIKKGIDVSIIQFHILPGGRLWIRDNGAQFLINDDQDIAAVDFNWNNYGYYDWLVSTR